MGVAFEDDTAVERRVVAPGKAVEQRPRRRIVGGDRRQNMCHARLSRPHEQFVEHPAGEPLAPSFGRDRDLPDEEGARFRGRAMPRNPAENAAATLGDDAIVGEMRALNQIEVARIAVERRAGRDQRGDRRPVGSNGLAKLQRRGGPAGRRFLCGWCRVPFLWPVKYLSSPEIMPSAYSDHPARYTAKYRVLIASINPAATVMFHDLK